MKLFYSNAAAKEEIAALETQVSNLKSAIEDGDATIKEKSEQISKLETDLAEMTKERDEAVVAFEASEISLASAKTELETASAKLATFDDEVEKKASTRFAGLGGNILPESSNEENGKQDPKTRALHKWSRR